MTADVQRELAERRLRAKLIGCLPGAHPWHEIVDAHLLPTVQALIADAEKRAAVGAVKTLSGLIYDLIYDLDDEARDEAADGQSSRSMLLARVASQARRALDPSGAAEGAGR